MNISQNYPLLDQNQNFSIAKPKLTTLPNVLWVLAASFLELNDLKNLSLTNRIFMEALSTFSDEFKSILSECIKSSNFESYKEKKRQRSLFSKTSTFSLPILLQLKSLTHLNAYMVKRYQRLILTPNYERDVLSKCQRLIHFDADGLIKNSRLAGLDVLAGLNFCKNLTSLTVRNIYNYHLDNFLITEGWKLKHLSISLITDQTGIIPRKILEPIVNNCPNLTNFSTFNQKFGNDDEISCLCNLTYLTSLTISGQNQNLNCDKLIPLISSRKMVVLCINNMPLTQKFIDELAFNSRSLIHIDLSQKDYKQTKKIEFSRLYSNLPNIRILNLPFDNKEENDSDVRGLILNNYMYY